MQKPKYTLSHPITDVCPDERADMELGENHREENGGMQNPLLPTATSKRSSKNEREKQHNRGRTDKLSSNSKNHHATSWTAPR